MSPATAGPPRPSRRSVAPSRNAAAGGVRQAPQGVERGALNTAGQHALKALRRLIVSGSLRPGQRVNQDEVAVSLELSIAPVREALRVLEQEGQLTYVPRRGYFVTELRVEDLEEIYSLRQLLEERAARRSLPAIDEDRMERIALAARACAKAAESGDVTAELEANRAFHFTILTAAGEPHTARLIGLLWSSTEAYRAMYYNSPAERSNSLKAHDRIIAALRARDPDLLVAEQDRHRHRALEVLRGLLDRE